jgi:hypothetical protein
MKIIYVNSEQFNVIWERAVPANRIHGQIPHPCIVLNHLNAIVLLDEGIEVGSLVGKIHAEDLYWKRLTEFISNREYTEVA